MFLLLFARAPSGRWKRIRDVALLALAGLTGPFCLLLWPIAMWRWVRERSPWLNWTTGTLTVTAVIQGVVLLTNGHGARSLAVGSPVTLARIIAGQVVLGSILGMRGYTVVTFTPVWRSAWFPVCLAVASFAIVAWGLAYGPALLRAFVVYSGFILLSSLVVPIGTSSVHPWQAFVPPGNDNRYYFMPMLAWISTLTWGLLFSLRRWIRAMVAACLLGMVLLGVPGDWEYPPYQPLLWAPYAEQIQSVCTG